MRNVKDILNKWWNVLGKRRTESGLPYTFIKSVSDDRWYFECSGGANPATISVYLNGTHYHDHEIEAGRFLTVNLIAFAEGVEITLTDELAPGSVKYLKVGDTVIFDNL